ncbi:hypothetical protein BDV38DRAFT_238561 [Aspergillus pseudotamarii]|uniref:Uncharacterized protein n=1 Tax=Aspergillus pseudotamarii TaxID=132259 RepID=A0A5N6T425_ASPPS|nr:uncharacterized protein BDV38DRAFT_238561 [Aspergillus pseudotamarii]KAE8141055.1 hypothetical protein BDV38DRAFT_238561 [Aspergillus pseudotamarii]
MWHGIKFIVSNNSSLVLLFSLTSYSIALSNQFGFCLLIVPSVHHLQTHLKKTHSGTIQFYFSNPHMAQYHLGDIGFHIYKYRYYVIVFP